MNLTKTRIWGSPLSPSPSPEGDDGAQPGSERRAQAEGAHDLRQTRAAPIEQQQPAGEPAQRISPRSGTRIMNLATLLPRRGNREHATSKEPSEGGLARGATRILPVEQLVQGERRVEPEQPRANEKESQGWPAQGLPEKDAPKNVMRLVCVALLAVCIVLWAASALVTPDVAPSALPKGSAVGSPAALPTPLPSRSPEHAPRASAPALVSGVEAEGALAEPPQPIAQANDARARAAVDALVRGDEELARSLYEELAKARPEQPVFAEAARILRTRQASEQ